MIKRTRRQYIVEVDIDPVPGWNDSTRPDDMKHLIEKTMIDMVRHYNPVVTYKGIADESK